MRLDVRNMFAASSAAWRDKFNHRFCCLSCDPFHRAWYHDVMQSHMHVMIKLSLIPPTNLKSGTSGLRHVTRSVHIYGLWPEDNIRYLLLCWQKSRIADIIATEMHASGWIHTWSSINIFVNWRIDMKCLLGLLNVLLLMHMSEMRRD